MSTLSEYLCVNLVFEDGKVVGANVNLKNAPLQRKMVVMGSTMVTSISIEGEEVRSFSVLKPSVMRGMVDVDLLAVKVVFDQDLSFSDFIVVDWRKEEPLTFNLSRGLWMPWLRLGQIVGDRIDVIVANEVFTTYAVEAHKQYPWDNIYEVPADTLLGYIADQCGVEQMYDGATAKFEKAHVAALLKKYEAENRELLAENEELFGRCASDVRKLQAEVVELVQKFTAVGEENCKLTIENAELNGRLERVMANFWKERAECFAWQAAAKIWYTRYQILRKDVLGREFWAWVLGRLTRNIDAGKLDPEGDKYPEDKDVLSCLPREKEEESEFVAP